MNFLSLASGIDAASVAWRPLGWSAVGFSEIEPFPCAVLKHHYPDVPNFGDMTRFKEWPDAAINVLVGGTPCQTFSIAGLRAGLADPRGNLSLTYLAVVDRYRPEWFVWENVPGVFSSESHAAPDPRPPDIDLGVGCNGEEMDVQDEYDSEELHAFNSFLAGISELGYGYAYRVLDAQYIRVDGFARAVPQRRRRVIVVGNLRDWRRAAAVLFERESMSGDSPPGRAPWQGTAGTISAGLARCSADEAERDTLIAGTVSAKWSKGSRGPSGDEVQNLVAPMIAFSCKDYGNDAAAGVSPTLRSMNEVGGNANAGGQVAVAFKPSHYTRDKDGAPAEVTPPLGSEPDRGDQEAVIFQTRIARNGRGQPDTVAPALNGADAGATSDMRPVVALASTVRRLTPAECERLQGFPDGYTRVPYRGQLAADGPRYKALGNSMAVNMMRWLGTRIALVHSIE